MMIQKQFPQVFTYEEVPSFCEMSLFSRIAAATYGLQEYSLRRDCGKLLLFNSIIGPFQAFKDMFGLTDVCKQAVRRSDITSCDN